MFTNPRECLFWRRWIALLIGLGAWAISAPALAREWTLPDGSKREADLVDFDSRVAVLKTGEGYLLTVPIDRMSSEDAQYLKSRGTQQNAQPPSNIERTWMMSDGTRIAGRIVGYERKTVTLARNYSRLYVNNTPFETLNAVQKYVLLRLVGQNEWGVFQNGRAIENLLAFRKNNPLVYQVDAVVLAMPEGDLVDVPLNFFAPSDFNLLQPGWQAWLAADRDQQRQDAQIRSSQLAAANYQVNKDIDHRLQMLQFQSQWFDLWEVGLMAPDGETTSVVVPARDSRQAQAEALAKCPNCTTQATRMISRR